MRDVAASKNKVETFHFRNLVAQLNGDNYSSIQDGRLFIVLFERTSFHSDKRFIASACQ